MRLPCRATALLLALGSSAWADETENLERLRSMPPEQRKALAKNLASFDALPRDQRAAIREVDGRVAAADPTDRIRYHTVLRRYHLWLATLPDEQRKKLEATAPAQRMPLVNMLLKTYPAVPPVETTWTQFSLLSPRRLVTEAYQIKVWLSLSPEEKAKFPKIEPAKDRNQRLLEFGKQKQLVRQFQAMQQDVIAALKSYIGEHPEVPDQIKEEVLSYLKDHPKGLGKDQPKKRQIVAQVGEAAFWQSFRPTPVSPEHLAQFADALPGWLLEPLDSLPPEAARARLLVLYRMIYPRGTEMPAPAPAPKGKEKPAPESKTKPPAAEKATF
jgi:hypothetical protein